MSKVKLRNHTVNERTQNVHDEVRVEQFRQNVDRILLAVPKPKFNLRTLYFSVCKVMVGKRGWKRLYKPDPPLLHCLWKWWRDTESVDKLYRMTYLDLFRRIWEWVLELKLEREYIARLELEFQDFENLCFTGLAIRTVNALVGLAPDIHLGLTLLEHLNNWAVVLLRSRQPNETCCEFAERCKRTMTKVLNDANVTDMELRQAYLNHEFEDSEFKSIQTSV